MKKILVLILLAIAFQANAQNKTFGVGTASPNPNAALHVESPTNNQGFIMPRLTTAQRTAMASILTVNEAGMILYDTDLKAIFNWNGTAWLPASSTKLGYPYKDSVVTSPPAGVFDVFALKYNAANNARVMRVESISPTNQSSALSVLQSGRGLAGFFDQANDTTLSSTIYARVRTNKLASPTQIAPVAVYGESTGVGGLGGAFWNLNTANNYPALYSRTLGVGNAARFDIINATSNGTSLVAATNGLGAAANLTINNPSSTAAALNASTNGLGSAASFSISNPANTQPTLFVNNNANSTTVEGLNSGIGRAGEFFITNPASTAYALVGETNGGNLSAGVYGVNTGNGFGVFGKANGSSFGSAAVYGEQTGAGDAAGAFRINNPANTFAAVFGETNGTGTAVSGIQMGNSTGSAGYFQVGDVTNNLGTGAAVFGAQNGLGRAGTFQITNTANAEVAIRGFTNGTGRSGFFTVNNSANSSEGLFSTSNGTGSAGKFQTTNSSSTAYALVGESNGAVLSAGVYGVNIGEGFGVFGKANGSALGSAAVYGEQTGTGDAAGAFRINNAANTSNAVYGETNGTASAINAAQFGTGTGLLAQIVNAANTANAIRGITNGTGNVILLNHTGASGSVAVFQSNTVNVARIDKAGVGYFNGGTLNSGADVAEAFEVEGSVAMYEPGDVLVISERTDRTVEKSSTRNSRKVVGVYATKPGVLLTEKSIDEDLSNTVPMGVIGVIPTKVCLENGPIKRGDLLVTSSEKGKAMKAKPVVIDGVEIYPQGAIIGKALENYDGSGKGLINVLVNVK